MVQFNIFSWGFSSDNIQINSEFIKKGEPNVDFIPPLLRRRLSPSAKHILNITNKEDLQKLPFIYISEQAQIDNIISLIKNKDEGSSPMKFGLSVNNAMPGVISMIVKTNQEYSVIDSIEGGLEHAIFTGVAMLDNVPKVGIVLFSEKLPAELFRFFPKLEMSTYALSLIIENGHDYTLSFEDKETSEIELRDDTFIKNVVSFLTKPKQNKLITLSSRLKWNWEK